MEKKSSGSYQKSDTSSEDHDANGLHENHDDHDDHIHAQSESNANHEPAEQAEEEKEVRLLQNNQTDVKEIGGVMTKLMLKKSNFDRGWVIQKLEQIFHGLQCDNKD